MISCSVMPGTVVPPASEWTPDTAGILQESMLEAVASWHPAAQALVRELDLDSVFAITVVSGSGPAAAVSITPTKSQPGRHPGSACCTARRVSPRLSEIAVTFTVTSSPSG